MNRKGAARAVFALGRQRLHSAEKTCPGSPATAPETAAAPWAFGRRSAPVRADCGTGMGPVSCQAKGTCPSSPRAEQRLPVPETGLSDCGRQHLHRCSARERGEKGDPLGTVRECEDEPGVQTRGAKGNRTWGTEGFPQPCSVSPQQGQKAELLTSLNALLHPGLHPGLHLGLPPSSHKRKTRGFLLLLYGIWQAHFLSETAFRFELQKTFHLVSKYTPAQTKAVTESVSPLPVHPAVAEASDKGQRGHPRQGRR